MVARKIKERRTTVRHYGAKHSLRVSRPLWSIGSTDARVGGVARGLAGRGGAEEWPSLRGSAEKKWRCMMLSDTRPLCPTTDPGYLDYTASSHCDLATGVDQSACGFASLPENAVIHFPKQQGF